MIWTPGTGWRSPDVTESAFRNPRMFCLWDPESGKICFWFPNPGLWNPEYSSKNPESHRQLQSRIQVQFHRQRLKSTTWKSEIHEVESRIQDCLGFPYIGRTWLRVAKQPRNCMQWTFWDHDRWINMHIYIYAKPVIHSITNKNALL